MKSWSNRIIRSLGPAIRRWHWAAAVGLLSVMFGLGISSMMGNSAIVDELAHVPAGYAYVKFGDYRLNPEHPPLVKDLAGIPLQFLNLKFPLDSPAWTSDINGQWEIGWSFLYHLGNDADSILFWSRLPVLLLAIGFGLWLYWFARRRWGTAVALLALFLYALSPNILGHSALVTTDLGATAFIFAALVAFGLYMERPSRSRLWWLSLALALAQLAKFSAFLLYPFLGIISLGLAILLKYPAFIQERLRIYVGGFVGASALSVVWIWIFYAPQTWSMPASVQDKLINGSVYDPALRWLADVLMAINNVEIFKPLAQYILGLSMVFSRVNGGNVTYFNGQVTDQSFPLYFPQLFLMKTQISLLILMLVLAVMGVVIWRWWRQPLERYIVEWVLGGFALFYFAVSVAGNLNLGIRHILPIYGPIFVLVAVGTVVAWRRYAPRVGQAGRGALGVVLIGLLGWYGASTVLVAPYFIPYFNESIGGPAQADKYFSDSNVDWGQDLLRLKNYVEAHPEIDKIAVDYFGGGVPEYYFCKRLLDAEGRVITNSTGYDCSDSRFEMWHSQYGKYTGRYIAVSETFLQNDRWYAAVNNTPGYEYLRSQEPIAKVGYSIYVYKLY